MRKSTFILAALAAGLSLSQTASANQIWQVVGGTASVRFQSSNIRDLGLKDLGTTQEVPWREIMADQHSFAVSPFSTFKYETHNGGFVRFVGGDIQGVGGFQWKKGQEFLNFQNFVIRANGEMPDLDMTLAPAGDNNFTSGKRLDLISPLVAFDMKTRRLQIAMMDMSASRNMAQKYLRPLEAGALLGVVSLDLEMKLVDGDPDEQPDEEINPPAAALVDASMSALGNCSQSGHTGTFPTGKAGFAMSTTSCGVGTANVNWFAPMNVNHPTIAQNMYRLSSDGKFEQIGEAYLKHGFLATNSTGCGTCPNPGTQTQYLRPGCSDTYGTGNNNDPRYLGPRSEVNPLTGVWNCTGSLFANFQPDCTDRRSTSTTGLDGVVRRIEVRDADLNVSGANFIYEGYYIIKDDENRYNQIAWRKATATWSGSVWSISPTTAMTTGPAINGWGDSRATFGTLTYDPNTHVPTGEGECIVAVRVTSPSSGRYYYDYAIYNHTLDRQVKEFSLPIETGLSLTNVQFRDIDQSSSNNWSWEYANGKIRFFTPDSPLKYANTYNFRFEVNAAPQSSTATLLQFKPGTEGPLTNTITGPMVPQPTAISGNLTLQDWGAGAGTATIRLRPVSGGADTLVPVAVAADGSFSFTTTLRGDYAVAAKGTHWLRKALGSNLTISSSAITGVNLSLINGDVDNDNEVGPGDFGALSTAFGSTDGDANWNVNADLDGDGEVGPSDFGILSANFGAQGDD